MLLAGPVSVPSVLARQPVQLWDPNVPESHQPYHAALDLPEKEGAEVVRRASRAVQAVAIRALRELAEKVREAGHKLTGIGLVVGSDSDPEKLTNAHVRAHALEGRLFRQVLEEGADTLGVPCLVVLERDAFAKGAAALGRKPDELKRRVMELGRSVGPPWGVEEKTAFIAAWMALVQ